MYCSLLAEGTLMLFLLYGIRFNYSKGLLNVREPESGYCIPPIPSAVLQDRPNEIGCWKA